MQNTLNTSMPSSSLPLEEEDELSLSELLSLFTPYRKHLFALWLGTSLLGYGLSFAMPVIFTAKAKILPPQHQGGGLSAMLSQLPINIGGAGGLSKDQSQLYIGLLGTAILSNRIVEQFNLKQHYHKKTISEAREVLQKKALFTSGKDTLISIEVDDEDPQLAAKIANTYPDELNKLLQSVAISDAALRRKFFEEQLKKTKQELSNAEVSFKRLQEETGILRLEDQGRAALSATSSLRAQIVAKQVEMQALQISATNASTEARRLQAELDALQAQLTRLENSSAAATTSSSHSNTDIFNLNIDKIPLKGMEYMRSYRELKFQETMYELMVKQYELAKMEEARTSQTVQLIDPALVPERKSKPKRSVVAALTGFTCLFIGLIFIFFRSSKPKASR